MTASIWSASSTPLVPASVYVLTERLIATAGQTVFTLTAFTYQLGGVALRVFRNGQLMTIPDDYTETTTSTFTFTSGMAVSDEIFAIGNSFVSPSPGATSSDLVTYLPAGSGATTSTVQAKLRESVSLLDFGTVADFATLANAAANTAAIHACWAAADEGSIILYPNSLIYVTALVHPTSKKLFHIGHGASGGTSTSGTIIIGSGTPVWDWSYALPGSRDSLMQDIEVRGSTTGQTGILVKNHGVNMTRVKAASCLVAIEVQKMYGSHWNTVYAYGSDSEASSIGCYFNPTVQGVTVGQVDQNIIASLQVDSHNTSGTGLKITNGSGGTNGNIFLSPIATLCNTSYDITASKNTFIGAWSEQVNTAHLVESAASGSVWLNPDFLSTGTITYGLNSTIFPMENVAWTPSITIGGSTVGITYGAGTTGTYTKVGNRLFFDCRVTLTSKGGLTGAILVVMPVTMPTTTTVPAFTVGYANHLAVGATTQIMALGSSASTNMSLYHYAAGSAGVLGGADITNTFDIVISGSYVF